MTTGGPWDNSPRRLQVSSTAGASGTKEDASSGGDLPRSTPPTPPPRAALGVWTFSFWVTLGSRLPAARFHSPERNRLLSSLPLNRRQKIDSEPVPDVS